ncbi:hypothetical protein [Brevundimonas sp.]|uniref:hypothetical protein n=1 Tax=Brevundimonas sp. TaxID=1871086 RepID=UPI0035B427A7
MKNYVRPALAGAGGAAVVILAIWLLSLPAVISFADRHNGLAAWVQAIFSVAAIVAGLLGSLVAVLQRQVDLANKHPHGWLPAFGESMSADVQTTLEVCRQRRGDLEKLFDDIREVEEFHGGDG